MTQPIPVVSFREIRSAVCRAPAAFLALQGGLGGQRGAGNDVINFIKLGKFMGVANQNLVTYLSPELLRPLQPAI